MKDRIRELRNELGRESARKEETHVELRHDSLSTSLHSPFSPVRIHRFCIRSESGKFRAKDIVESVVEVEQRWKKGHILQETA